MAIGIGGKIFGVRGGVRIGSKGIGYGVGAGPFKATGGQNFGQRSDREYTEDGATAFVVLFSVVIGLTLGIGVVVSFLPLLASSIILFVPCRTKSSRTAALVTATLVFGVLTRVGWNFIRDQLDRAMDSETSGVFSTFVAVMTTGWILGVVGAVFFFVYSVVRGKNFYDQIYLRPEK